MRTEKSCESCFDLLAAGVVHKQVPFADGTECKAVACPQCHGRGVLAGSFEGWNWCPTCRPPEFPAEGQTREANRIINDLLSRLEMCKGDRTELSMEVERFQTLRRDVVETIMSFEGMEIDYRVSTALSALLKRVAINNR